MSMQVKKIEKKIRLNSFQIIRCQLINELIFIKNQNIIPSDIDLLALLCIWGKTELNKFCLNATKYIYKDIDIDKFSIRSQGIRNKILKLEKRGFINRINDNKKSIILNSDISITKGTNILVSYNYLSIETSKA